MDKVIVEKEVPVAWNGKARKQRHMAIALILIVGIIVELSTTAFSARVTNMPAKRQRLRSSPPPTTVAPPQIANWTIGFVEMFRVLSSNRGSNSCNHEPTRKKARFVLYFWKCEKCTSRSTVAGDGVLFLRHENVRQNNRGTSIC
jgi:hypothetical protein